MSSATRTRRNPWARELDDIVRAASGGFLFSIPLRYTMEVWWVGAVINGQRMAIALVASFASVFLLNHTAGFRRDRTSGPGETLIDTTQALAIRLVATVGILALLRRITPATPPDEALGKVVYEAAPFALGAAVASQLLSGGRSEGSGGHGGQRKGQGGEGRLRGTWRDLGATAIGATFIGFTIPPPRRCRCSRRT